jgi:hypothetical protein
MDKSELPASIPAANLSLLITNQCQQVKKKIDREVESDTKCPQSNKFLGQNMVFSFLF